jgi:hypothetical protein
MRMSERKARTRGPAIVRHCVPHCEHCDAIHAFPAARWMASSFCAQMMRRERRSLNSARAIASNERNATLFTDRERIHATHRRTAVEIATCPRQCAVALRSNFCPHTNRMVNPQANVLTSAGRRSQMALKGRVRVLSTNDTSPCRCDRFAIEPAGGYTNAQL